jgi:hypothetical protein
MSQANERAFETYVEEILLTRGGSKTIYLNLMQKLDELLVGLKEAVVRLSEYHIVLDASAVTGGIDIRCDAMAIGMLRSKR